MRKYKEEKKETVVFSFWKGEMYPLNTVYSKLYDFIRLAGIFALINTVSVMFLGRSFICGLGIKAAGVYCENSVLAVISSLLLALFVIACFINRWYALSEGKKSFSQVLKMSPSLKDLQIMGFILVYLGLFALICGLIYFLNIHKASQAFGFELMLFVALSLVIIGAVILLLNFVIVARFLQGERWWVLGKTIIPVFDNVYKIVFWFLSYLLFFVFLMQQVLRGFLFKASSFINAFCGEFFLQFIAMLCAACFVSALCFQAKSIFKEG